MNVFWFLMGNVNGAAWTFVALLVVGLSAGGRKA